MADITMCTGEGCPLRTKCHRFLAKADEYQSYFTEVPYDEAKKDCDYLWLLNQVEMFNFN